MKSFKKIVWHGSLITLVAFVLGGCDDKHDGGTPPNGGGGGVVFNPDQFGMAFATAFNADSNGEPKTVNDGDIVAVSLTSEPVTIN
ncbi:MAG: hypothetical protein V4579_13270 [Pseudomonadota bacterium]